MLPQHPQDSSKTARDECPSPNDCPGHDWANAITWRICRVCGDVDNLDVENECADGWA